jgi:hypothetical protein
LKTLVSSVDLERLLINGVAFTYGVPLEEYNDVVGVPSRSESPGPPAPYGHRNNVIHFYDSLGILLREHHATRVISGITFLLETQTSFLPTTLAYQGELWVCGVKVCAGTRFKQFSEKCEVQFTPSLRSAAYADGGISIHLTLVAPSRKRGSKKTVISEVAVGFRGAHRFSLMK